MRILLGYETCLSDSGVVERFEKGIFSDGFYKFLELLDEDLKKNQVN